MPNAPIGKKMVAGIHSHPQFHGFDYENFSTYRKDQWGNDIITGDLRWARDNNLPLYVVTPSGKIKKLTVTNRKNYNRPSYKVNTIFKGIKW